MQNLLPVEAWRGPVDAHPLEAVVARYGLGAVQSCCRMDHGYVNQSWMVDASSGRYVVRRRHPLLASPRLVMAQHALVRYLQSTGFPAPRIYNDRCGATFLVLQGQLYEVYQYLDGVLCDVERPTHVLSAARTLGRYHQAVEGFDHNALRRTGQRYSSGTLARTVRRLMHEWRDGMSAQLESLISSLWEHVEELEAGLGSYAGLPELVIHGDYYAENLIMRGDEVLGVIDYDQAHWCPRSLEVAEALIYFAREPEKRLERIVYSGALDLEAVARFLMAYGSVVYLSDAELGALGHLVRTIWMCAALDPPLRPRPSALDAPQVLPEILYLADWARDHAHEIAEIGLATRRRR